MLQSQVGYCFERQSQKCHVVVEFVVFVVFVVGVLFPELELQPHVQLAVVEMAVALLLSMQKQYFK